MRRVGGPEGETGRRAGGGDGSEGRRGRRVGGPEGETGQRVLVDSLEVMRRGLVDVCFLNLFFVVIVVVCVILYRFYGGCVMLQGSFIKVSRI